MTKALTKEMDIAMTKAVAWLAAHGGSGVLNKFGRVLAAGEIAEKIDGVTWLRCVFSGRLKVDQGRIYVPTAEEGNV